MSKTNQVIQLTQESQREVHHIFENMSGNHFHDHISILWDLRSSISREEPIVYMEIGAYAGASASLMARHPYGAKVYSLDLGAPVPEETVYDNVKKFENPKSDFLYIKGNSQDKSIIEYAHQIVKKADILFIDGDHSHGGVTQDYLNYCDIVKDGGYMVFDDYMDAEHSPEVKKAVDDLVQTLHPRVWEVIGSLKYSFLNKSNVKLLSSNEFIIRKREVGEAETYKTTVVEIKEANYSVRTKEQSKKKSNGPAQVKGSKSNQQSMPEQMSFEDDEIGFPLFVLERKLDHLRVKADSNENQIKMKQLVRSINLLRSVQENYISK